VKKKMLLKRSISLFMSAALVLGIVGGGIGPFSARQAEAAENVVYEPVVPGAPILPSDAVGNSQLMTKYVVTSNTDTNLNCNAFFKLSGWSNINKDVNIYKGRILKYKDVLRHESNNKWSACYQWRFENSQSNLKELMTNGQIQLNYDGNLTSDYHKHIGTHNDKKWDVARVRLFRVQFDNGEKIDTCLIDKYSEKKDDGRAQHVTYSVPSSSEWANTDMLQFNAGHSGCNCGSSKVGQSIIYLSDLQAPYIQNIYTASDSNGTQKIASSGGFKAGEKGYIVLEFNEYLRFGNNKKEALTLNLDAYWVKNDQKLANGSVTAKLISLKGNKMIFEFSVPQTTRNETTNVYITGISSSQNWVGNSKSFDYTLNDENGSAVPITDANNNRMELKTTSKVTDIAGNGINWSTSKKTMSRFYMDALNPSLQKIEISGSHISSQSSLDKSDWPADIDRSAVFAGQGDDLTFSVYFSEELKMDRVNLSNIKAILNIKDKNGKTVELTASRTDTLSAKSVFGVDAFSGNITKISFQKLIVEKGMTPAAANGEPIRIVSISGMDKITDLRKNSLGSLSNITKIPVQQQYLDTLGPKASTALTAQSGSYTPFQSGEEIFTFPVTITDDKSADSGKGEYASGVTGITGKFSLTQEGAEKNFQWYVDTNQQISKSPRWKSGKTSADTASAQKYELIQMEGANAAYIHIKLDKNTNYNYSQQNKIYFHGNLNIYARDYAGNESETCFAVVHKSDQTGPVLQKAGDSLSIDYENNQATITARLRLTDNYAIKSVQYYWGDNASNPKNVALDSTSGGFLTKQELSLQETFGFTEDNSTRMGSKKLTILAKDMNGNLTTWTANYPYDFRKLMSEYSMAETSRQKPCKLPELSISLPKNQSGSIDNARTMLLIPTGSGVYYVYLAYDTGNTVSVFANMPDTAGSTTYTGKNHWFRLEGAVTEDGGTFTKQTQLKPEEVYQVKQWLMQQYGAVEFTFVTSETLYNSGNVLDSFDFLSSEAMMETKTVWLANQVRCEAEVTEVLDAQGEPIQEKLAYAGQVPVSSLDGAGFTLKLANLTEASFNEKIYGLGILDYTKSKVTLNYLNDGKDGTQYSEKYSWTLDSAENQTILLPQGKADQTGWYQLKITLCDTVGGTHEFQSGSYFIYKEQIEAHLSEYHKTYVFLNEYRPAIKARKETGLEKSAELTIGTAQAPEGWELSRHELVFQRTEEAQNADCPANSKIKVWSQSDENGESNALWIPFAQSITQAYTPVCVEEITRESYQYSGTPVLPLTEGDNVVRYQVMNTNGIIETKEILLHAISTVSEFELETKKTPTQEAITPVISETTKLLEPKFYCLYNGEGLNTYTLTISGIYTFYLYNSYGNLYSKEYEVTDVDGVAPQCWISDPYGGDPCNFDLKFEVDDYDGEVSPEDAYLTFDTDYSALLMGLTGEERKNNTEQIRVRIPVDTEQENKVWESFDSMHYGIYRTEILSSEPGKYTLEIMGTFKYDDSIEEDRSVERTFTVTAYDKNKNAASVTLTKNSANRKPSLSLGAVNANGSDIGYFDENGNLGVNSCQPFMGISGYGSSPVKTGRDEYKYYMPKHYTDLPMITTDGNYKISYTDLFNTTYTQEFLVTAFQNEDIQLQISNREYTNENVIVTAKALNPGDAIESILSADFDGKNEKIGTIDEMDASTASIVMAENGKVTVTTRLGKTHSVRILNIDKELKDARVIYTYNDANEPQFVEGSEDTVSTEVTAVLQCDEDVDGINGPLTFTFPLGSKKGSEHVFEYCDRAGNTGSMTAVLPYDIAKASEEIPDVDTEAPEFSVSIYGMRNDKFYYLATYNRDDAESELTKNLQSYIAQKYSLIFDIRDTSKAKLLIKETGAAAPASFEEESDKINGVQTDGSMITVSENATFQVYFIDEANNVSAPLSVSIESIDNQAPAVNPEYKKIEDENGVPVVRVIFQTDEAITSWDSEIRTFLEEVPDSATYVTKYYYDFLENGKFTFHYKDVYGNSAAVDTEVNGMNTDTPRLLSTKWYGTTGVNSDVFVQPSESSRVNHDITAVLNISKAVSKVNLYWYDASKEGSKGEAVTGSAVAAQFTGTNVSITWTENTDKKIVAEIFAAENNKTCCEEFPEISCIDKTAPTVTQKTAELSKDCTKKTFTFETDEETMLSEASVKGFRTEHTWTSTDQTIQTLHFTDRAGNVTEQSIDISDIDDKLLALRYSKSQDGTEATDNALDLELASGDTVYIMANKKADITMDSKTQTIEKDTWTAFVLEGDAGFYAVKAVDAVTHRTVYGTLSVKLKDYTAPVIKLENSVIHVIEGTDREKIDVLVHSSVTIWDDRDGEIKDYTVTGVPEVLKSGLYELVYTAADQAGNTGTQKRILYIGRAGSPLVQINGKAAQPYGTTILRIKDVNIKVDLAKEEPAVIKWKAGIKTSGQMKYSANTVKGQKFTVPAQGFYTVYVRTQSRKEFVTYIYVEE